MATLKLSDIDPNDVQAVPAPKQENALKLSDIDPNEIQAVQIHAPGTEKAASDWSKGQSFGQGALQGATAGFSDELGGVLGAGMEKIAGNPDKKSLKDLYKEYRDFQRKRNEDAQKANPASNLAGNVAGAVGGAVLMPELMAPKTVAGAAGLGAATGLGSSNQDLTDPTAESLKGAAQDVATGTALGAGAGLVGKGLQSALSQEGLEAAANKAADSSVGIKPTKDLARVYDPTTGKMQQGSTVTKGIGKTALDQGAVPWTGGPAAAYDNSLQAINKQYDKLNPIMAQTQQKLNQNLDQSIQAVGGIGTKAADFLYDFRSSLDSNPNQDQIMKTLETKYLPYIQKLTNADGNLQQLTQFKRALQETATDLNKAAYDQPASDLKPEAEFVKNLGGIVRQHIEDLAGTVDENASQQIADTNKTLSNLYTYSDYAKKTMDKPQTTIGAKDVGAAGLGFLAGGPLGAVAAEGAKLGLEVGTGNSIKRLGQIGAAKGFNQASKAVQTPAGQLVQQAVVSSPVAAVTNPFTQSEVHTRTDTQSARVATNLYNATNDSLKNLASKFNETPGLQFYGDHLNKALETDDVGEKNRAIFLIMQNPISRKMVTPDSENK